MYIVSWKRKGMPDEIKRFSSERKAKSYLQKLKQNGRDAYLTKV